MADVKGSGDGSTSSIWYLGYGSMANPVSLQRRGILPSKSVAVRLHDYDLEFSMNGMANIARREGAVMHGIAHCVTQQMFEILHKIESVYDYAEVACWPYAEGSAPIVARAFIVPPEAIEAQQQHLNKKRDRPHKELPSERYIRIICEGLEHFGADPAWIAHIKQQPFNPARPRSEWMIIPEAPEGAALPLFTLSELEQHKGRLPAVYAIGRKVVRAEVEEGHPFAPIMKLISGNQACMLMLMNLYDPALPPLEGPQDLQPIHLEWAEDQAMETALRYDFPFQLIGYLDSDENAGGAVEASSSATGTAGANGSHLNPLVANNISAVASWQVQRPKQPAAAGQEVPGARGVEEGGAETPAVPAHAAG